MSLPAASFYLGFTVSIESVQSTNSRLILDAYTAVAGHGLIRLPDAGVHVLGSKFIRGGETVDGTIGLDDLLIERFDCDAHFSMYTSPSCTRLLKGNPTPGIRFDLAVLDLD